MADPRHVAIVMDGNGRWAQARGLPRTAGHAAGEEALFDIVHGALGLGIEWLTVFTFSTENWNRPTEEVEFLMGFKEDLLTRRRDELHELGVRVRFLGDRSDPRVSDRLRDQIRAAEDLTAGDTNMTMVFAFNYGSPRRDRRGGGVSPRMWLLDGSRLIRSIQPPCPPGLRSPKCRIPIS